MALVTPWHVGSSWIRDQTPISCVGRWILYHWATREAPVFRIFKVWHLTTLIRRRLLQGFSGWSREYPEPCVSSASLQGLSMWTSAQSERPGSVCSSGLPGWVSLASSLPVVLRFESLLWPRWPPRPHRVLGPGPTPMSPGATLGSLTCIFWVALFLSSSETRSSKTKLHPNTSASVRYFFSLTNSLKREISQSLADRLLCSTLTLSCSSKPHTPLSY